jgi:hypothetical protein
MTAQKWQSYNGNPEKHPMTKRKGYDAPNDLQKSVESDPKGEDDDNASCGDVPEDLTHYATGGIARIQSRARFYLSQEVVCLSNGVAGSRRALGAIPAHAYLTPAHPGAIEWRVNEMENLKRIMSVEKGFPEGSRRERNDKQGILAERTLQKGRQPESKTSNSTYDTPDNSNSSIPQEPEHVGEKYQEILTPFTCKIISKIVESSYIAVEIESAANMLEVATDTQKITYRKSTYPRRAVGRHVEITPWESTRVIEIPNTINRNERGPKERTARKSSSALTQSTTQLLVSPSFEPVNSTSNHNQLSRELAGHQEALSLPKSTSNDCWRSLPAIEHPGGTRFQGISLTTRGSPAISEGHIVEVLPSDAN